jgi:hypothetical protein
MTQFSTEDQQKSYLAKVTQILTDFVKETGGVQTAILIDDQAEMEAIYSESSNQLQNLDSIGATTAQNMIILATQLQKKSKDAIKTVQEVEIVTESLRIFTLKVSTDPDYTLCVICPIKDGAKAGLIKDNFKFLVKDEITTARQELRTRKKE